MKHARMKRVIGISELVLCVGLVMFVGGLSGMSTKDMGARLRAVNRKRELRSRRSELVAARAGWVRKARWCGLGEGVIKRWESADDRLMEAVLVGGWGDDGVGLCREVLSGLVWGWNVVVRDGSYGDELGWCMDAVIEWGGDGSVLGVLVEMGADINKKGQDGVSLLMKSIKRGNYRVAERLLRAGASEKTGIRKVKRYRWRKRYGLEEMIGVRRSEAGEKLGLDETGRAGDKCLVEVVIEEEAVHRRRLKDEGEYVSEWWSEEKAALGRIKDKLLDRWENGGEK